MRPVSLWLDSGCGRTGRVERPCCVLQGQVCVAEAWERDLSNGVLQEGDLRTLPVRHRSLKRLQLLVMWWKDF